uniref:Uncharacterized protein n=1 Tax=Anguilla anguilla TaxID=7936 RepID=A0A0E9PI70_ANGAN
MSLWRLLRSPVKGNNCWKEILFSTMLSKGTIWQNCINVSRLQVVNFCSIYVYV